MFNVFDHYSAPLQKDKKLQTHHNWDWINWQIKMGIVEESVLQILQSISKYIAHNSIYLFTKFNDQMV